jgi:hypothetical protein
MKILMTLQASDPDREYKVERVITIGFDDEQWDVAEAVVDVERQVLEGIKELVLVSMVPTPLAARPLSTSEYWRLHR